MKSIDVELRQPEQVSAFVNLTNCFPYSIDLRQGRFVVDAKSLLGIFSLDRSKPATLEIYSDNCDELMRRVEDVLSADRSFDVSA